MIISSEIRNVEEAKLSSVDIDLALSNLQKEDSTALGYGDTISRNDDRRGGGGGGIDKSRRPRSSRREPGGKLAKNARKIVRYETEKAAEKIRSAEMESIDGDISRDLEVKREA